MTGTTTDIVSAAKLCLRQGMDLIDAHEAVEFAETAEARAQAMATADAMEELVKSGYEPEPMPRLGIPTREADGSLCFLARDEDMRRRAKASHASGSFEEWVYFDGHRDATVTGRVAGLQLVHDQLMFNVKPE